MWSVYSHMLSYVMLLFQRWWCEREVFRWWFAWGTKPSDVGKHLDLPLSSRVKFLQKKSNLTFNQKEQTSHVVLFSFWSWSWLASFLLYRMMKKNVSILFEKKLLKSRGVRCPQNRGGTLGQIFWVPPTSSKNRRGLRRSPRSQRNFPIFSKNVYSRVKRPLLLHSQVFLFNISKNRRGGHFEKGGARPKVAYRERTRLLKRYINTCYLVIVQVI